MIEDKLPEELDSILTKVNLKQPPEQVLKNFSSDVDRKIEYVMKSHQGFHPTFLLSGVMLIAVFVGLYVFYSAHQNALVKTVPLEHSVAAKLKQETAKTSAIEKELETLEVLDPDFDNELFELAGDEYFLEDYSGFDEAEFSAVGLQNSLMR